MRNGAKFLIGCAIVTVASAPLRAHDGASHLAGEPGDGRLAAKVVEIVMTDADGAMAFAPDRLQFHRGEAVEFVIHNQGKVRHEFVLGTKAENGAHAAMMAEMPEMKHEDAAAKTLEPGTSASLVWQFSRKGEFEFACLIPGHYQAGMHGVVVVE